VHPDESVSTTSGSRNAFQLLTTASIDTGDSTGPDNGSRIRQKNRNGPQRSVAPDSCCAFGNEAENGLRLTIASGTVDRAPGDARQRAEQPEPVAQDDVGPGRVGGGEQEQDTEVRTERPQPRDREAREHERGGRRERDGQERREPGDQHAVPDLVPERA